MRKKSFILGLICVFMVSCFAACGKKKTPDVEVEPVAPTVSAYVLSGKYYVGETLSTINVYTNDGSTPGTISWLNPSYSLVLGNNTCVWKFVPSDSITYTELTGSINIVARERPANPNIVVSVVTADVYDGTKLSTVELTYTPQTIEGTLSWANPNEVISKDKHSYNWSFVPTDVDTYRVASGSVTIETILDQTLESIDIETNPTKLNYEAFDTINDAGMTLKLVYNAGREEILTEGWTILYNDGETLHAGDTSVTVSYEGFDVELTITEVAKKKLANPLPAGSYVYTGEQLTIGLASSEYYTAETRNVTNAGTYDIEATLNDSDNFEWLNSSSNTISVEVVVAKTELLVANHNYSGVYDALAHSANVEIEGDGTVYYSLNEINASNYLDETIAASTEPIEFINATQQTNVYYFVLGGENYNNKTGVLTVAIDKMTPVLTVDYCYTVQNGDNLNFPASNVKVFRESTLIYSAINSEVEVTYYLSDGTTLTTNLNSGAERNNNGSAPAYSSDQAYVVNVRFLGNSNFNSAEGTGYLFIDDENNGFYAKEEESEFAFKQNPDANGLCFYYLEFDYHINQTTQLPEILCKTRLGNAETKRDGVLMYISGEYRVVFEDGTYKSLRLTTTSGGAGVVINSIAVDGFDGVTIEKWNLPNYVATYERQTISDDKTAYENKITTVTIYNDYGTLRFLFEYNTIVKSYNGGTILRGGSGSLQGVIELTTEMVPGTGFYKVLNFYVIGVEDDYRSGSQTVYFSLRWLQQNDNETVTLTAPNNSVIVDGDSEIDGKIKGDYTKVQ